MTRSCESDHLVKLLWPIAASDADTFHLPASAHGANGGTICMLPRTDVHRRLVLRAWPKATGAKVTP